MNRGRNRARGLMAVVALLSTLSASASASASPAAADVLAGLERWLDGTRDLEGSFRQSLVSGALGSGLEERGRVFVKRPGQMRWDYRDPERKVAIVDGERVWLYVADERELTVGRLEENGRLLPALLAADRPLSELFEARFPSDAEAAEDGTYRLELRPRSATDEFERVVVVVRERDFEVRSAEVQDSAGNRMLYTFSDLRRNRGLPDGLFRFDPPKGTTVVGQD